MKNAFYAQSGGVTAVINASACGVIETARRHRGKIGKVYAGRHGIIGALTEDMIDTSKETRAAISALRHTPAGAFGSPRYGLAAEKAGDAPHVILVPEIVFDQARYPAKVKASVEKYGYCVVVVSEGLRDSDGKFLAEAGTKDAFGHAQLGGVGPVVAQMTQEAFGYKFHWAVADYLQRSARHIASKVDVEQAYAVGKAAVELALRGRNAVMPVIVRKSSKPYP